MIRLIGYWKTSFNDDYPLPQELETVYPPEVRGELVRYLEAGALLVQYRGPSWCRYACGQSANGSRELFDGVWAWPEGLPHYLREHSVALPQDFIEHAIRQTQPPRSAGNPDERLKELDDAYWLDWARPYRTPAVTKMLEEASASASRACDTRLEARAAELAAQLGVGDASCAWAGCDRRALAGKAICARHAVHKQFTWIRPQVEFEELCQLARKL